MRDPSPELVARVRSYTRAWGRRHGVPIADLDDLEGELLAWLATYEPPDGWNQRGAVIAQLPWRLVDAARRALVHRTRRDVPVTVVPVDPATIGTTDDALDPGYAEVELELLLDTIPIPGGREALLACATHGDAAELARREHVDLSTIHKRAGRARAHVLAALEEAR